MNKVETDFRSNIEKQNEYSDVYNIKKITIPAEAYYKQENADKTKSRSQINAFLHLKNQDSKKSYLDNVTLVEEMLDSVDPSSFFEKVFSNFFKHKEETKKYPSWVKVKNNSHYKKSSNDYVRSDKIVEVNLPKLASQDPDLYNSFLKNPNEWIYFFKLKLYIILKRRPRLIFSDELPDIQAVRGFGYGSFESLYKLKGTVKRLNNMETSDVVANVWKCMYCPTETFVTKEWFEKDKTIVCKGCGLGSTNNPYLYEKANHKMLETWLSGVLQTEEADKDFNLNGETRLFNLRIFNTDLGHNLKPGDKVEILGILKRCNLGTQKEEYTYLETLAIKKITDPLVVELSELTAERIEELKLFSKNKNFWNFCFETLFPDISGLQDCKKITLLQQFSHVEKKKSDNELEHDFLERNNLHVLLVGDAGCGKSRLLTRAHQIFGGLKTCGYSSTNAGLTAGIYKDSRGQWGVDAGILILGNKQTVYLDELDKIPKNEIMNSLLECMEQQVVSIAKMNTHGSYEAKTSIFAAANPRYKSNFDTTGDLISQIELPQVILSRFDLVVPVLQDLSYKDKIKMKTKIPLEDLKLIKDYINYSKTITEIEIPQEIWTKVDELLTVVLNRIKQVKTLKKEYKNLNPRTFPSLLRLICAKARSRLSKVANLEDFKFVKELYLNNVTLLYNIEKPLYNEKDILVDLNGVPLDATKEMLKSEETSVIYDVSDNTLEKTIGLIKEALELNEMSIRDLIAYISKKDASITQKMVQKAINKLENHGYVYKPDLNKYKLTKY